MKLFIGFLTLVVALIISGVAAYFSVVGLAAIFSATFWAVVVMGCSLETGKLVAAGWLHSNWNNPKVNKFHKGYMVAAVCALMVITALGIYGFLAKGHLAQQTPLAPIELQISQKQARIDQINTDIARLTGRQTQIDGAVNAVIGQDATKGLTARRRISSESKDIQTKIDADTVELNKVTADLVPLKLQVNDVETKLGPIKYLGEAVGLKDTEAAVRIVILILMFAFDPLAVVLILSSTISVSDGLEERRNRPAPTVLPKSPLDIPMPPVVKREESIFPDFKVEAPMPEIVETPQEWVGDSADHDWTEDYISPVEAPKETATSSLPLTDKEHLLDILERKPELLQDIVSAIQDQEIPDKTQSWLDTGRTK